MEQQFEREFEISVPANGLGGVPPSRERRFEMKIPNGFTIKRDVPSSRHGAVVARKKLESMDERRLDFEVIPDGIAFTWKVRNPHTFPLTGRTARIIIRLTGEGDGDGLTLGFSDKYQKIRQRFFERFYFAGLAAEAIDGDRIKFADQTIYMGQVLIFLATESYIKARLGEATTTTNATIREVLDAVDQLDRDAETLFGAAPALNGFVARDNITGPDDPRLQGRFAQVASDWQKPKNAAPSGDQIFGLLYGLWFVVKYVDDPEIITRAKELAGRLFDYARRNYFELTLPNGEPTARGSDMRWLASLLNGLNKKVTGIDQFDDSRIKVLGAPAKLNTVADFWNSSGHNAANIFRASIHIPGLGQESINSFAAHIILMAIAPGNIWSQDELEQAALAVNHHLAALTYAAAHNKLPQRFGYDAVAEILDRCPDTGPRSNLAVERGWHKDNRWIRSADLDVAGDGQKEYNGVDFLVLHNLAQVVYAKA